MSASRWEVNVLGDAALLAELSTHFTGPPMEVAPVEDGGYALRLSVFDSCTDPREVRALAEPQIIVMNGVLTQLGRRRSAALQPGVVVRRSPDGGRHVTAFISGIEMKASCGDLRAVVSGDDQPPPPRLVRWIEAARTDTNVAKVFRIRSDEPLTWDRLYVIFEVIEHDLAGNKAAKSSAWFRGLKDLATVACNTGISGDGARHGVQKKKLPKVKMSVREARRLVEDAIERWLELKGV